MKSLFKVSLITIIILIFTVSFVGVQASPIPDQFVINDNLKECKLVVGSAPPANWTYFKLGLDAHEIPDYLLSTDEEYGKLLCDSVGYEYDGIWNLHYAEKNARTLLLVNNKTNMCKVFIIDPYSGQYNNLLEEGWRHLNIDEQKKIAHYRTHTNYYDSSGSYALNKACSNIGYTYTGSLKGNISWVYKPDIIRDIKNKLDVSDLILFVILPIVLLFLIYGVFKFRKKLKPKGIPKYFDKIKNLKWFILMGIFIAAIIGLLLWFLTIPLSTSMSPSFNLYRNLFMITVVLLLLGVFLLTGKFYSSVYSGIKSSYPEVKAPIKIKLRKANLKAAISYPLSIIL